MLRVLTLRALWTVACQAPLSMDFSRQEYWNGLPIPCPIGLDKCINDMYLPVECLYGIV